MTGTAPWPVIDRVAPQSPGFGSAASGIEHRQRGVVGEPFRARQRGAEYQIIQRRQPPAGAADPVAQGGTVQCDALALQHLGLAIQRRGITELADQHMRDHRLGGHAAIDQAAKRTDATPSGQPARPLRRGGNHHSTFAGPAGVTRAACDAHPQLRGHDVELLAAQFADRVQHAAAAGAVAVLDVDQHLIARQMRGQRTVVAIGTGLPPLPLFVPGRVRILRGLVGRKGLLQILDPELQLIGDQVFGAAAELVAQQTLYQQLQLVDFGIALLHGALQDRVLQLGLGDHLAQQVPQRGGVVRQ